MTKFNFSEALQEAEKTHDLGRGSKFKVKEGANKIRLVSECLPHESEYMGNKNFKFLCHVLDRADNQVKLYFMPVKIYKDIQALQLSEDYSFQEVPMPYDVTINAVNAGTIEVQYSLMPAKNEVPLTDEELELVENTPSITEVRDRLENKKVKDKVNETNEPQVF